MVVAEKRPRQTLLSQRDKEKTGMASMTTPKFGCMLIYLLEAKATHARCYSLDQTHTARA